MSKTVFLFSGQGSQYKGMGNDIISISPNSKKIISLGSEIIGIDLNKVLLEYEDNELSSTLVSQPAIFTMSMLAFDIAKSKKIQFSAVAGHSLGEYAALTAAGVLSLEDGFRAIKYRSQAMENASKNSDGAMAAILGSDESTVKQICDEIDGYVIPVNFNSPAQTVIAGEAAAVEKAMEKFTQIKKKAVKLAVSSAFHSKLMQSAADEFKQKVKEISFKKASVEVYSNIYGDLMPEKIDYPEYLAKHIVSPVKFTDEMFNLEKNGYVNFIELGPNKVLSSLVKRTLKGVNSLNIENSKTLEKALSVLEMGE